MYVCVRMYVCMWVRIYVYMHKHVFVMCMCVCVSVQGCSNWYDKYNISLTTFLLAKSRSHYTNDYPFATKYPNIHGLSDTLHEARSRSAKHETKVPIK